MTQFGFVSNLMLGFAVAALGLWISLLRDTDFHPHGWPNCSFVLSGIAIIVSFASGIWCSLNRLWDFRITAEIARGKLEGKELIDKRTRSEKLGGRSWALLYWQIATLVLAAIFLGIALGSFYRHRLTGQGTVDNPTHAEPVPQDKISPEEVYARQVMKGLSPDDVISVCGKPLFDSVGDYGDYKWRVLDYPNFTANFVLKEGRWQYDFMSENGRVLPDADMVTRPAGIKLPCEH